MDVPAAVPTAQVAARRPGPRRVAVAAAVVLAVTIIRPWDATATPAPGDGPGAAVAADVPGVADQAPNVADQAANVAAMTASATAHADPSPAPSLLRDEIACNPGGWTVVSLDRLGPWTVRSWVPAHAVRADGPLDPGIDRLTLESPEVLAIGVCTPAMVGASGATVAGGPARIVGAWHVDAGEATRVHLGVRRAQEPPTVAMLYRPEDAPGTATTPAQWPAGDYVLELQLDRAVDGAAGRWFLGVVVRGPG